ncbi:MAG: YfhO family protein [Lachnospiraceae bacterium]|nr:YfhO family protein [Lachnospiraceae bacterium]
MKKIREFYYKHHIKNKTAEYYLVYSAIFCIIAAVHLSFYFLNGKLPMKASDGYPQDYNAFLYWGNYIRTFIKTLIFEQRLSLPLFDPTIGYGADVLLTLHYHVIGDPFYLILSIIPASYLDLAFGFIGELRLYLAGISFSVYALHNKNERFSSMIGALLYAFSGYLVIVAFTNNMFAMPAIYFPLVLSGIDRIFEKKRPYLFIWATAFAATSNFYFFYMVAIFAVIYAIVRYTVVIKSFNIKILFGWIGKFLLFGAVAMMIACVIFLPVALHLILYMNRFGVEHYSTLLYPLDYYQNLLSTFITTTPYPDLYTYMGVTALGMLGVFALFTKKKKYTDYKITSIIFLVFICIPFFGRAFNGFAYMTNRWSWAYVFLIAVMTVKAIPEFVVLTKKEKYMLLLIEGIYCLLCLTNNVSRIEPALTSLVILVFSTCLIIMTEDTLRMHLIVFLTLTAGLFTNFYYFLSPIQSSMVGACEAIGTINNQEYNSAYRPIKEMGDGGVYRVDQYNLKESANTAMNNGVKSTAFYYSIYNNNLSDLFRDIELQNTSYDYKFYDLDGRSLLEDMMAVKYVVVREGEEAYLPYNFRENPVYSVDLGDVLNVYENEAPLPYGYTYDKLIDPDEYENMTAVERQQALLQGAYVGKENMSALKDMDFLTPEFNDETIEYTINPDSNIEIEDGVIHVKDYDARLEIVYEGLPESENYVRFGGLDYHEKEKDYGDEPGIKGAVKRLLNRYSNRVYHERSSLFINVSNKDGEASKKNIYRTYRHLTYCGQHNFIYNAGYSDEPMNKIILTFDYPGEYTFDEMSVICQPVMNVEKYVEARNNDKLTDIGFDTNKITCDISTSGDKLFCLTVPYSEGWSATVDGIKTEVIKTDKAFMGVPLKAGDHHIEFNYTTPFIIPGIVITILGIICFVIIVIFYKCQENKENNK